MIGVCFLYSPDRLQASQAVQWHRIHLPVQEMRVPSLVWEDPLEKEMAIYSSILAWRIPWIEEPGGLQSIGSQRVRHSLVTEHAQVYRLRSEGRIFVWGTSGISSNCF